VIGVDFDWREAREAELLGELDDAHARMLSGLKSARVDAGLSQEELAERLGWSVEAVREFESPHADPHMSTVRRYAIGVGAVIRYTVTEVADDEL